MGRRHAPAGRRHHARRRARRGYPALLDDDDSVSLRILTNADLQRRVMRGGVRRLLLLAGAVPTGASRVQLSNDDQLALAAASTTVGALATECAAIAIDEVLDEHDLPWDADAFAALRRVVAERAGAEASRSLRTAVDALVGARRVRSMLARLAAPAVRASVIDATDQLDRLIGPGFVQRTGAARLADVVRYVRGIEHRSSGSPTTSPATPAHGRGAPVGGTPGSRPKARHRRPPPELVAVRWQLEELRMSIFAQSLGGGVPVSLCRIAQTLAALGPVPPPSGHSASQTAIWSPRFSISGSCAGSVGGTTGPAVVTTGCLALEVPANRASRRRLPRIWARIVCNEASGRGSSRNARRSAPRSHCGTHRAQIEGAGWR